MTPMVAPPIMDPVPVGASETAYFIGTVVTDTDGNAASTPVTLEARDGFPDRDWASIVAGAVVLTEEAGGCFVIITGHAELDFSDASGIPDAPDYIIDSYGLVRGGSQVAATAGVNVPTDGSPTYQVPVGPGGLVIVAGAPITANASAGCFGGDDLPSITDGVATHTVVVNVTRLAPGPTLP